MSWLGEVYRAFANTPPPDTACMSVTAPKDLEVWCSSLLRSHLQLNSAVVAFNLPGQVDCTIQTVGVGGFGLGFFFWTVNKNL